MNIEEYERIQTRLKQLMCDKKLKDKRSQAANYIIGYKDAILAVKSMISREFKPKEK